MARIKRRSVYDIIDLSEEEADVLQTALDYYHDVTPDESDTSVGEHKVTVKVLWALLNHRSRVEVSDEDM